MCPAQRIDTMKVVPPELILGGLSVAVQRWALSWRRAPKPWHLVLLVIMEEKIHTKHELVVTIKLTQTIHHDL
jgi:hypothetical protein